MDTRLRTNCGTLCYQAPEQLGLLPQKLSKGSRGAYTNAVDLWALGCLLHELLTSEIPFLHRELDSATTYTDCGPETTQTTDVDNRTDMKSLYEYCHGMSEFPTARLEDSRVAKRVIEFVKSLLVADPRHRISALDALKRLPLLKYEVSRL